MTISISSAGGGKLKLIGSVKGNGTSGSLTVTGLNLEIGKNYIFEVDYKAPATGFYNLYVNGDETTTNYYNQYFYGNGASLTSARLNEARMLSFLINNVAHHTIFFNIMQGGYCSAYVQTVFNTTGAAACTMYNVAWYKTATVASVTTVTIKSSSGGNFQAADYLKLYEVEG